MEEWCVEVTLPELQEGKEVNTVCIVMTDALGEVEKIVCGRKLGTQGTEYGVHVRLKTLSDLAKYPPGYEPLYLDLETFKRGIEQKQIDWHQVIEWQRWGKGIVNQKEKRILINEHWRQYISPLWEKLGYKIENTTI